MTSYGWWVSSGGQTTTRWFQASSSAPLACSIPSMMPSLLPLPIVVQIVLGNLYTRSLRQTVLPSTPSLCSLPLTLYKLERDSKLVSTIFNKSERKLDNGLYDRFE